jgi:signal peptidase I
MEPLNQTSRTQHQEVSDMLDVKTHGSTPTVHHKDDHEEKHESFLGEVVRFSLIALVIVLPVRLFIAQPFIVSGASMEATFSTGQYLIVDQLTYHFEAPARGEVIVFRYPKDPSKFFIKRIIGIPGDTVHINGNVVTISNASHPEGVVLDESYILSMAPSTTLTETLGDNEYFVMGDNRDASSDSRMWGVLQRENIIGRAFLRLFPLTKTGVFPGNYDINAEIINAPQAVK